MTKIRLTDKRDLRKKRGGPFLFIAKQPYLDSRFDICTMYSSRSFFIASASSMS